MVELIEEFCGGGSRRLRGGVRTIVLSFRGAVGVIVSDGRIACCTLPLSFIV